MLSDLQLAWMSLLISVVLCFNNWLQTPAQVRNGFFFLQNTEILQGFSDANINNNEVQWQDSWLKTRKSQVQVLAMSTSLNSLGTLIAAQCSTWVYLTCAELNAQHKFCRTLMIIHSTRYITEQDLNMFKRVMKLLNNEKVLVLVFLLDWCHNRWLQTFQTVPLSQRYHQTDRGR